MAAMATILVLHSTLLLFLMTGQASVDRMSASASNVSGESGSASSFFWSTTELSPPISVISSYPIPSLTILSTTDGHVKSYDCNYVDD